jgi:hypothetical protein
LKIKRPGRPETRIEIDLANVGSTIDELQAIGENPEKFTAFVWVLECLNHVVSIITNANHSVI